MSKVTKIIPVQEKKEPVTMSVFCVHAQDYLLSPMCPLKSGSCYWQHRDAPKCMYDKEFAESNFSTEEFCQRVGIPAPPPEVVNNLRERMQAKVRKALAEK